eukprot:1139237-Pelagomonas_calceolata.AAC.2
MTLVEKTLPTPSKEMRTRVSEEQRARSSCSDCKDRSTMSCSLRSRQGMRPGWQLICRWDPSGGAEFRLSLRALTVRQCLLQGAAPHELISTACCEALPSVAMGRSMSTQRGVLIALLGQGSPKYRGLRILHGSAEGASLGTFGDGGGPGIEPSWR